MDDLAALVEKVPDEILDYIEDLETRVEKAEAQLAEVFEAEPTSDPDANPIEKALAGAPAELVSLFKAQNDRLTEAEEALAAERLTKADAEWTSQVRSVDGLIDDPTEFGPKLRAVADVDPELANSIVSALQAAQSRVAKSALFSEIGHGAPAPGSAQDRAQAIAKSMIEADPNLTQDIALAKVWETNPDLYDQYTAERREAVKNS